MWVSLLTRAASFTVYSPWSGDVENCLSPSSFQCSNIISQYIDLNLGSEVGLRITCDTGPSTVIGTDPYTQFAFMRSYTGTPGFSSSSLTLMNTSSKVTEIGINPGGGTVVQYSFPSTYLWNGLDYCTAFLTISAVRLSFLVPPTLSPTTYSPVTSSPTTRFPTTLSPTFSPTVAPTTTPPTLSPTAYPTSSPTSSPTTFPTYSPTNSPTNSPTKSPSRRPTLSPTAAPSYPLLAVLQPPPITDGEGLVVVTLSGVNGTSPQAIAEYYSKLLAALNLTTSQVKNAAVSSTNTDGSVVISIVVSHDIASNIEDENGAALQLGYGVQATLLIKWPSFVLIFQSLSTVQIAILVVAALLFLIIVVILHIKAKDTGHILPVLALLMSVFSYAINIWLLAALHTASSTMPTKFFGFFIAFLVLIIAPPLANVIAVRTFLRGVLQKDPEFREWLQDSGKGRHCRKTGSMYGLALFGGGNVALLGSKLWWCGHAAPMRPLTIAHFSSLGSIDGG